MWKSTSLALTACLVVHAPPARAQQVVTVAPAPPPMTPGWQRTGAYGGFAMGIGEIDCEGVGCDDFVEAANIDLELGFNATPRYGVAFGLTSAASWGTHISQFHNAANVSAKVWPVRRLWLQAGAGAAFATYYYDDFYATADSYSQLMPAYVLAVGLEVLSAPWFALDVRAKWNQSFYDLFGTEDTEIEDLSFSLGVTWF
jgi:hypothetical protein